MTEYTTRVDHTAKAFDTDLQEITRKVAEMGGLVERQITDAVLALAELDIAIDQRLDGIGDLPLREAAHFGDLAGDLLQIGIECLGGVVDSCRGEFGHLDYPKRPVM